MSNTSENNAHWTQECVLECNPYKHSNNVSKYVIVCAKLKEGTIGDENDGFYTAPQNGYPDNMISQSNFKHLEGLSDNEYKWFCIETGVSGNQWIRTGISSANQNVLIPYMIYSNKEVQI